MHRRAAHSVMLDPVRILEKIDRLRAKDTKLKVFGATGHEYVLHERISEKKVSRFEHKWGCKLPDDYRRFFIEVGNGGVGPAYGLFPLGMMDDGFGTKAFNRGGFVGDPSKPFVHRAPTKGDRTFSGRKNRIIEEQWHTSFMDGALPICHLGCALRQWLVVTGPCAGEVWNDDRADDKGISPLVKSGERIDFARWYEDWLDESLRKRL